MDKRPYHNHGGRPCSKEKHAAIRAGLTPFKDETAEQRMATAWRYALDYTRTSAEGVRCACCGELYDPGVG